MRDFGEFKSKGIAWCRFEDPFATNHLLASKLKFGNLQATVQLWGVGEAQEVQSKPAAATSSKEKMQRALALTQKKPTSPVTSSSNSDESSHSSGEVEEEAEKTDIIQLTAKLIVGNRVVELDSKEKCSH